MANLIVKAAIGMAVDGDNVDGGLWAEFQFSHVFDGDKVSLPTADLISKNSSQTRTFRQTSMMLSIEK